MADLGLSHFCVTLNHGSQSKALVHVFRPDEQVPREHLFEGLPSPLVRGKFIFESRGNTVGPIHEDLFSEQAVQMRQLAQAIAGDLSVESLVIGAQVQLVDAGPVGGDAGLMLGRDLGQGHQPLQLRAHHGQTCQHPAILDRVVVHAEPVVQPLIAVHVVDPAPVALAGRNGSA